MFLAGIFAGWVNVLAGGGSFLTLPALTYSGLGIDVANGTNRLAILLQNIVAVAKFRKSGFLDFKKALVISSMVLGGALLGSIIAVSMPKEILKKTAGFLLLVILFFMIRKRKRLVERGEKKSLFIRIPAFLATGVYGGFIQAGVGFFLIYDLVALEGMDVVQANAYKVFTILVYTAAILPVFILSGKFDLIGGLILSAGNMIGAYLGTRAAVSKGAGWVRWVVIIALASSATLFILGV